MAEGKAESGAKTMNSLLSVSLRSGLAGAVFQIGRSVGLGCVCSVASLSAVLAADLPLVRLDSVLPAAAQAGAEVEVQVSGVDLEGGGCRLVFPSRPERQACEGEGLRR